MNRILLHALFLFGIDVSCFGADLQFFGDLYLPNHVIEQTQTNIKNPGVFEYLGDILKSSGHNIINFEGVATDYFGDQVHKRFHLRMPVGIGEILRKAGITAATLANNHSMDFGYPGLVDSLRVLRDAGIATAGAGRDAAEATRALRIKVADQDVCVLACSRTFPESFWASFSKAGTAHPLLPELVNKVRRCALTADFTAVSFHWGSEMSNSASSYQRELAQAVIKAGADMVIGHHPHVLQEIEIIEGRPVFYSLGNFAFGSRPSEKTPQGMAVQVTIPQNLVSKTQYELVPLKVSNREVGFRPRLYGPHEFEPVQSLLPSTSFCQKLRDPVRWHCIF